MNEPIEELIRTTLTDLAEEAPPVPDQTAPSLSRASRRRTRVAIAAVTGVTATVLIGTPLAFAAGDRLLPTGPPPKPAPTCPAPTVTAVPPDPTLPPARLVRPDLTPMPSPPPGPAVTLVRPAPTPSGPVPAPSPTGDVGGCR